MLDTALVIVSQGVVAVAATVIDDDVALAVGGLGHERRGWGVSRGGVGQPGSVCRRFGEAGGCFSAGGRVVVVAVDVVGVVDGGCVGVVNDDVAALGGPGYMSRVCVAVSMVLEVTWVLKSMQIIISSLGGSIWRVAHRRLGSSLVCMAVSSVLGAVWVLVSLDELPSDGVWHERCAKVLA